MKIEILGMGCTKCDKLYRMVKETADELGLDYELVKVQEIKEIIARDVIGTPALVVNGRVVLAGSLPTRDKLKELLTG